MLKFVLKKVMIRTNDRRLKGITFQGSPVPVPGHPATGEGQSVTPVGQNDPSLGGWHPQHYFKDQCSWLNSALLAHRRRQLSEWLSDWWLFRKHLYSEDIFFPDSALCHAGSCLMVTEWHLRHDEKLQTKHTNSTATKVSYMVFYQGILHDCPAKILINEKELLQSNNLKQSANFETNSFCNSLF